MRLTDGNIRKATLTEGKRYRVLGDGRGGYGLRLVIQRGASGKVTKSFTQRLYINGKQTDIGIGSYPLFTLDHARAIAIENARRVRLSRPSALDRLLAPVEAQVAVRTIAPAAPAPDPAPVETITFGEAYERNIQLRIATWQRNTRGRSSSEKQWRGKFNNYLADAIGDMPIHEITSRTMQEILEPLWTSKPTVATDICSYANIVFEWAIGREYITSNPVNKARKALGGKPRTNGKKHHAAIAHGAASTYYAAIEHDTGMDIAKHALRFLMLTAARKEEVLAAQWCEIDFHAKTWTIPGGRGGRMKAGLDHVVPLADAAIAILKLVQYLSPLDKFAPDAFIFSTERKGGAKGGKKLAAGTINNLVKRVNAKTNLDTVPHGFRSTFRDWCADMTDAPRELAEMCLAHDDASAVERAYRRTDYYEKRRELMDGWAAYIAG